MAHRIELPYDQVFSTVSREWHGLANLVPEINREVIKANLFDIVEGEINISLEGESVKMEDKAIVADWRYRDDLPEGQKIRPLSVMGKDYTVITNSQVLEAVETSIKENGLDAKIVTAGTLRAGKSFFVSLQQDASLVDPLKNGDTWDWYLNGLTSHDGVDGLTWYLCSFRTVCWNTARWGCDSSDIKASIHHTKNANLALKSLPELLVAMKNKQTDLMEAIAHLAGIKCDVEKASRIVAGYFIGQQDGEYKMSTRAKNTITGIVGGFSRGQGNAGQSAYDLLNGVTEYYTSGEGTGKKGSLADRTYKANFGGAADHKERFTNLLMDSDSRQELEHIGSKAIFKD